MKGVLSLKNRGSPDHIVVDPNKFSRCIDCKTKIPRVYAKMYPNDDLLNVVLCVKCAKKPHITINFNCTAIAGLDDFKMEIAHHLPFEELLAAEDEAGVMEQLRAFDCYPVGSSELIDPTAMMCDGGNFMLTRRGLDLHFNHTGRGEDLWLSLDPNRRADIIFQEDVRFYTPALDTGTTLKAVLGDPRISLEEWDAVEACLAYLQTVEQLPRISMKDVVILAGGKFVILPFKRGKAVDHAVIGFLKKMLRQKISCERARVKLETILRSIHDPLFVPTDRPTVIALEPHRKKRLLFLEG